MQTSGCTPVPGCAYCTAAATAAAASTKGILSRIESLKDRLSINRSTLSSTAGKAATESLPSNAQTNSKSETRYQASAPCCRYLRYARKEGSAKAAATKSLRLDIQATASTCAGCATNKTPAATAIARRRVSASATR